MSLTRPIQTYFAFTIILLIASGVGLWMWIEKSMVEMEDEETIVPIVQHKDLSETEIDTSTWKTYRNEKYGFEVGYPIDWPEPTPFGLVGENLRTFIADGQYFEGCCSGVQIEIIDRSLYQVYKDLIKNIVAENLISQEMILFDGREARRVTLVTHYGDDARIIYTVFGNKTMELKYGVGDELAEQIISTFKFTK
ncbi:MAG: hypothetical protein G01um101466_416 [Parcubacteria group bacterium Gr01-1014_66]|nr:MAG: hypothetical protein G01um101466_416 [Parcubacteria group bacterium Gr01-1014_66]